MKMTSEAIEHYLFLTEISYDYGLIDIFTYENRKSFLHDDNNDDVFFEGNSERPFVINESNNGNPGNPVLLLTTQVGALGSVWKFTLGDSDYFPSIPHGHLKTNLKIKLDSYLGHTYDTSNGRKELKRESRNYIKLLWNNPKFRYFATKQINWYLFQYPHYKWRVSNPRRIPAQRP